MHHTIYYYNIPVSIRLYQGTSRGTSCHLIGMSTVVNSFATRDSMSLKRWGKTSSHSGSTCPSMFISDSCTTCISILASYFRYKPILCMRRSSGLKRRLSQVSAEIMKKKKTSNEVIAAGGRYDELIEDLAVLSLNHAVTSLNHDESGLALKKRHAFGVSIAVDKVSGSVSTV